jgi:hypothetical protein
MSIARQTIAIGQKRINKARGSWQSFQQWLAHLRHVAWRLPQQRWLQPQLQRATQGTTPPNQQSGHSAHAHKSQAGSAGADAQTNGKRTGM